MAKKERQKIRTVSYVHAGDEMVRTDQLTDEQRQKLGTWIKTTWLNELFRGQAEFYEEGAEKNAQRISGL